jgi:hypothetical protein
MIHYIRSILIKFFFRENIALIKCLKLQKFRKEFEIKQLKLKNATITTQFN